MLSKTTRYTRHTYGDNGVFGKRNVVSTSFAATDLGKVGTLDGDAYLDGATAGTYTSVLSQPTRARNVTIKASAGAGDVVVTGKNAEGATISETITISGLLLVQGAKAFSSVTSVVIPSGATVDVGYGNKFGVGHRIASDSQVKILVIAADGSATLENASASTNNSAVESNTVTPTTTPDGAKQMRIYSLTYNWHVDPINAQPSYGV